MNIDALVPLLKLHEYFREVGDDALQEVAGIAQLVHYPAGSVVRREEDPIGTIGFVMQGRLKALKIDSHGNELLFRMIERGEQIGMMVGALSDAVPLRVVTLEPSKVLSLDHETAMDLTLKHADLRRRWMQSFAASMRRHFFSASPTRASSILALFHQSPETRNLALKLIERLRGLGEEIAVLSDAELWKSQPGLRFRSLSENGRPLDLAEIREQATAWQDARRIVFDVSLALESDKA
jgi:NTE family protein